jgi:hypothetical protein
MEQTPTVRAKEDIALDLLKFVAAHANVAGKSSGVTPGFGAAAASKSDDQVEQLLELYARCRSAVEAPADNE